MSEESSAPEMQKYVFGTLDFGQGKKVNPLAYTDVPETAGLARSINP